MAAKPPKPPGTFLKNLLSVNNNNISNNNNNNNNNEEEIPNKQTKTSRTTSSSAAAAAALNSNSICANADDHNCYNSPSNTTTPTKKSNCNCTNITIMHLFHEMKQEFPTIPDTIVTQCVNENCHQRENCIQMLKTELELNPIPVQSYPAKVLHPQIHHQNNHNNNNYNNINNSHHNTKPSIGSTSAGGCLLKPPLHQKPLMQQKLPLKPPLKPVRPAPLQPPPRKSSLESTNSPVPNRKTNQSTPNPLQSSSSIRNLLSVDVPNGDSHTNEKLTDMPATTTIKEATTTGIQQIAQANSAHHNGEELNNNEKCSGISETNAVVGNLPRVRPTTLNLNVQQQQQQRQRLNVQLQEHFQQQRRQQQQPQQQQQQQTNIGSSVINKPLRKAPLPPIAPKPIAANHSNNNINHNITGGESSVVVSPQSESEISANLTLSTPSPTSSTASSTQTTAKTHHTQQHLQNKSPMRHRSVITLQPEPPYTRDFLLSQATAATQTPTTASSSIVSSPTNSVHSGTSQKSYTSVNLTLRPPTTVLNSALQPSAIDITAGPGFAGASGGGKSLSYSSTSYDARLGYQQNFHITVTDEGGVFSASRRRAQGQRNLNQVNICKNEYDANSDGDNKSNNCHSLYAEQQQQQQQQQQQLQKQQQQQLLQQQFHNSDAVALRQTNWQQNYNHNNSPLQGINCSSGFGSMCLAPQQSEDDADFVTETLERQKKRRDRLAGALRENKKRLSQVEHEVNLITGPIPEGLSERLDVEIQKLRAECQAMLRSSNPLTQQPRTQQQQFPPQPFPRQRSAKPPPRPPPTATVANMPRQTSLDIIQHHTTPTPTSLAGSSPHTHASLPNFPNTLSPTMVSSPQQQQLQHSHSISPSLYQQQEQQQQAYNQTPHYFATANNGIPDDEPPSYYFDQDAGDYDDDDDEETEEYEVVEHWECNMCTFRNHPQLNICECCDNVRILPGTLTNLSRALSANTATSATGSVGGGLTSVTNGSVTDINAAVGASAGTSSGGTMHTAGASGNLEHETNLAQQQMQHLALHI